MIGLQRGATVDAVQAHLPKMTGDLYKILSRCSQSVSTTKILGFAEKLFTRWPAENNIRFMNVRHPLARLNSAWRDKFVFWGSKAIA